ncbi:hypothetical protein [Herbaspirillum sp.]|uniref:hypothetical protein n=1 Tax=Herbaspirillum sp. TaxID=1890675 RepID=UPI001B2AA6EB|nr:hypothetical protein [Herbaspirillum sp.]MBO9538747.1 hypothetical protein [Herbaspirillum sp.]
MKRNAAKQPASAEVIEMGKPASADVAVLVNPKASALAQELGYDGPLSVGGLEDGIRFYQRRTVESLLEMGKRLLLLKEVAPHGEFMSRVQLLGISDRSANRFMQAATKVSKVANLATLATQVKSASAFLELVTHDDDVLEQLAEMDDIDRMSASELRERVRKLEADGMEDARAEQKRANRLEQELEKKDDLLQRLRSAVPGNSAYSPETNVVRQQAALMDMHCSSAMSILDKMASEMNADTTEGEQYLAQLHSVCFAAQAIHARSRILLDRLESMGAFDTPTMQDITKFMAGTLTVEEATWFLGEVEVLRSALINEHQQIQLDANESAQRGRGRPPKGAKNKK